MDIILASKSPRRVELLNQIGIKFRCMPANVEETGGGTTEPAEFARNNALYKAQKVSESNPDALVIGADTVVVKDGKIFGQPVSTEDAFSMLKSLSGSPHEVITGIAIVCRNSNIDRSGYISTEVWMRKIDDEEIHAYISTGEPMDKAGAYAIQGRAAVFVDRINGCYSNVVGLPISLIARWLKELHVI